MQKFPTKDNLTIQFAHPAYQFADEFARRDTGISHFQTFSRAETISRLGEADVLVLSSIWKDSFLEQTDKLKFVQAVSAGYNYFDLEAIISHSVILCNATGVNANAVSDHAFGLLLSLTRQIHTARDNQHKRFWRDMTADLSRREEELPGKTMLIVGLGNIGSRTAHLARAFGMKTIGIKRNTSGFEELVDEIYPTSEILEHLPRADVVVLTCPLTDETFQLIGKRAFGVVKPGSYLINVARGGCVDQEALVSAITEGKIAGAGIDTFDVEPLPEASALWGFENVIVTPHTAGETRAYEINIVDLLLGNLDKLWRGDDQLVNRIV